MARTTGPREPKLPDLDPTRDPQKPGPPGAPWGYDMTSPVLCGHRIDDVDADDCDPTGPPERFVEPR